MALLPNIPHLAPPTAAWPAPPNPLQLHTGFPPSTPSPDEFGSLTMRYARGQEEQAGVKSVVQCLLLSRRRKEVEWPHAESDSNLGGGLCIHVLMFVNINYINYCRLIIAAFRHPSTIPATVDLSSQRWTGMLLSLPETVSCSLHSSDLCQFRPP